jgi:pantoate--beta-alanine ligase
LQTVTSIPELRALRQHWRSAAERVAFVPTMGNLHEGHLQLVRRARALTQRVLVSVFVNPAQFGPGEDFANYPRTPEQDARRLADEGVDALFLPSVEVIYPHGVDKAVRIDIPEVSQGMCGDSRPGHFAGVATAVLRLLNLVQPHVAVFGEKDYQQLAVIRRMVQDLYLAVDIEGVATVREADGLAMSSRNQYLTDEQRRQAPLLYATLRAVAEQVRRQQLPYAEIEAAALEQLRGAGFTPDYFNIRHADTLQPVALGETCCVVLAAARLGKARLIDNIRV